MYPLKALRDKLIHAVRLQLKKLPEVKLSKVPLGLNSFFFRPYIVKLPKLQVVYPRESIRP